jgi:hypothetical protein
LQRLGEFAVFETIGADDQGSHVLLPLLLPRML